MPASALFPAAKIHKSVDSGFLNNPVPNQHFLRLNAGHALTTEIRQAIQQLADWVRERMSSVLN
ncbi:hypothetical protein [Acinetobacter sp. WCHA29]|uniref:hypothetical protein n=1 Tax=Acinetobacter sp. WCHA29 TaxID=2004649 RepID=UPI00148DEBFF|nr:hypothetical protein [Acinetobacter sp. WCHA29]